MTRWNNPPPVVVVSGTHDFLRQREIKAAILAADNNDRSIEFIDGTQRDELASILSSSGMFFHDKTLVIVNNADFVDKSLILFHHKNENNLVSVLLHQVGPIKPKTSLSEICDELPPRLVAKFEKPKPWEENDHAVAFCVKEARACEIVLPDKLAGSLVQACGLDLGVLSFEIRKVALYLKTVQRQEVTIQDLRDTIATFFELGPKPIVEALERHDSGALSRALINARRNFSGQLGGFTLSICAWVSNVAKRWLHVSALQNQQYTIEDIAARLNIKEFVIKKTFLPILKRWSVEKIKNLLISIANVERAVRKGHINPWVELECALFSSLKMS